MPPHPLASVALSPLGPAALVVAVLATAVLMPLASGPRSPHAPGRIVSLELAWRPTTAAGIVVEWREAGVLTHARRAVWWDFALIPAYATALALPCLLLARLLGPEAGVLQALLHAAAWLPLLAGLLDAVENFALLRTLRGLPVDSPWPEITFACAAVKFALLAVTAVALLAAALAAAGAPRAR